MQISLIYLSKFHENISGSLPFNNIIYHKWWMFHKIKPTTVFKFMFSWYRRNYYLEQNAYNNWYVHVYRPIIAQFISYRIFQPWTHKNPLESIINCSFCHCPIRQYFQIWHCEVSLVDLRCFANVISRYCVSYMQVVCAHAKWQRVVYW